MLGLQRGTVQVVDYSPEWAALFEQERQRLADALGSLALDIQHIGSTSVPGLAAKPILDVGVAIAAETDVDSCVPLLEALGYRYEGFRATSSDYFFDVGPETHLTHYLHMLLIDSDGWRNYLRFRDTLIAHPELRDQYMHLKQALAVEYADNRKAYTAGKAAFIQDVLAAAT
ncbi:MAG: hypothetical protein GC204_00915 [Chloroflexi bacterium]|nr:hypothetical protein [Chloroflexota bacterium]